MFKNLIFFVVAMMVVCVGMAARAQAPTQRLTLLFAGDIMVHDTQLPPCYDVKTNRYDFTESFGLIQPLISGADIAFANLETTLGGPPYRGYPDFSSPDELAVAIKECGFDVLVTANNHSCDRGGKGMARTNRVLDSLAIRHTGTFADSVDFRTNHPLWVEQNGISLMVLNYTYGINGTKFPKKAIVNLIDTALIKMDLLMVKEHNPDAVIVYLHWGEEYSEQPSVSQQKLAKWLSQNGVDMIIGSHPHVLQRMEWHNQAPTNYVVAYSLGNFLSGQRTAPRDGAAVLEVELTKQNGVASITNANYSLTYVHYPRINGIRHFKTVPVALAEKGVEAPEGTGWGKLHIFAAHARTVLKGNKNVAESVK